MDVFFNETRLKIRQREEKMRLKSKINQHFFNPNKFKSLNNLKLITKIFLINLLKSHYETNGTCL